MSMITEQVKRLRNEAAGMILQNGTTARLLREAADTIEQLSAKVRAENSESQPCEDAISRQAALNCFTTTKLKKFDFILYAREEIKNLPPVNPQPKTGHWIEIAKYSDGRHEIECSECGSHIFDRGHANSYIVKEKYKYCPRCGFRMVEPQE